MHLFLVLSWIFAQAEAAPAPTWIDAAERLGILAAIVLFSVLTGSSLIYWLLNRSKEREDAVAGESRQDKQQLAKRVEELDTLITTKLLAALEQTHEVAAQSAEALKANAASNDRTAAALDKMSALVESMSAERQAVFGLLRQLLGQSKEAVILGTVNMPSD